MVEGMAERGAIHHQDIGAYLRRARILAWHPEGMDIIRRWWPYPLTSDTHGTNTHWYLSGVPRLVVAGKRFESRMAIQLRRYRPADALLAFLQQL